MKYLAFFLLFSSSYAAVWQTTNDWNQQYREELKDWMRSSQVKTDMFTNPSSKYYGMKVDCADVTYALHAIFAYENGLPYKVKNPVYRNGHKYRYWSNSISKFDHKPAGRERLKAFVNFLGDSLGTETLSVNDSYPIKLKRIDAGDFYMYKKNKNGSYLRHAYNIKDVTDTGNFQLIWSNQQRKKDGRPMKYAEWSKLSNRPYKYRWGFRRFIDAENRNYAIATLPYYSSEQFVLARQMDENQFFTHVKNELKLFDEDPNVDLKRHLNNICNLSKDRIKVVSDGDAYRAKINNRCMNYTEYDEYSTPGRDGRLLDQFEKMKTALSDYESSGQSGQIEYEISQKVKKILGLESGSEDYCQISYKSGAKPISIQEIYKRLKNKTMSSHPNDNIDRRWGVLVGEKTTCKKFY